MPSERLGGLVDGLDVLGDGPLQFDGGAVNTAPDLLVRQVGEEALAARRSG